MKAIWRAGKGEAEARAQGESRFGAEGSFQAFMLFGDPDQTPLDTAAPVTAGRTEVRNRKGFSQGFPEREFKELASYGGLSSPKFVGQATSTEIEVGVGPAVLSLKSGKSSQSGFLCSLDAEFLLLCETSVFALRAFS